ncbi:hypothetical protein PYCC9005_003744 [Savitreella phatthalungensis]
MQLSNGLNLRQARKLPVALASEDDAKDHPRPLPPRSSLRIDAKVLEGAEAVVYDFDGAHDELERQRAKAAAGRAMRTAERRPRYMHDLLENAAQRQRDKQAADEERLRRERDKQEALGISVKESFITPGYHERQCKHEHMSSDSAPRSNDLPGRSPDQGEPASLAFKTQVSTDSRVMTNQVEEQREHEESYKARREAHRQSQIRAALIHRNDTAAIDAARQRYFERARLRQKEANA